MLRGTMLSSASTTPEPACFKASHRTVCGMPRLPPYRVNIGRMFGRDCWEKVSPGPLGTQRRNDSIIHPFPILQPGAHGKARTETRGSIGGFGRGERTRTFIFSPTQDILNAGLC